MSKNNLHEIKDEALPSAVLVAVYTDTTHAESDLDELASLGRVFDHMGNGEYGKVREALFTFDFERIPSGKRGAEGEMLFAQEKIKGLRNLAKETKTGFCTACFTGEYPVDVSEDKMFISKYERKLSEKKSKGD